MAVNSKTQACILALLLGLCIAARTAVAEGSINDMLVVDGDSASGNVSEDGQVFSLYLYKHGSSSFRSKQIYPPYVRTDMQIKLFPNNSAGTVTTCFLLSEGQWEKRDEIDLEFLGNVSGQPYTLHTNIYVDGKGQKEQQFRLWFDPAADFHTYSIVWNAKNIIMLVDGTPIREFRNHTQDRVPYPSTQPMRLRGSLWDADWATKGGFQANWTMAPFVAHYRNFVATASPTGGYGQEMDGRARQEMKRVRDKYMIYNYCTDKERFNGTAPTQCSLSGTG